MKLSICTSDSVPMLTPWCSLVAWVTENDASAARGLQLRAQHLRVLPVAFRDPDTERWEVAPARVHDQRQPVAQNGTILAPQLLVGREDTSLGPVAGKLDTPRSPGRAGAERQAMPPALEHRLGDLDAARADRFRGKRHLRQRLRPPGLRSVARDDAHIGLGLEWQGAAAAGEPRLDRGGAGIVGGRCQSEISTE